LIWYQTRRADPYRSLKEQHKGSVADRVKRYNGGGPWRLVAREGPRRSNATAGQTPRGSVAHASARRPRRPVVLAVLIGPAPASPVIKGAGPRGWLRRCTIL